MRIGAEQFINGIRFIDDQNNDIIDLDRGESYGEWITQELAEDESIIGIYGRASNNRDDVFNCLGFIVWNR